jgi:hypothetical protein
VPVMSVASVRWIYAMFEVSYTLLNGIVAVSEMMPQRSRVVHAKLLNLMLENTPFSLELWNLSAVVVLFNSGLGAVRVRKDRLEVLLAHYILVGSMEVILFLVRTYLHHNLVVVRLGVNHFDEVCLRSLTQIWD